MTSYLVLLLTYISNLQTESTLVSARTALDETQAAVPDANMEEVNGPAEKLNDDDKAKPVLNRTDTRGRPRSKSSTVHHMTRRSKSRSEPPSEMDTVKQVSIRYMIYYE